MKKQRIQNKNINFKLPNFFKLYLILFKINQWVSGDLKNFNCLYKVIWRYRKFDDAIKNIFVTNPILHLHCYQHFRTISILGKVSLVRKYRGLIWPKWLFNDYRSPVSVQISYVTANYISILFLISKFGLMYPFILILFKHHTRPYNDINICIRANSTSFK